MHLRPTPLLLLSIACASCAPPTSDTRDPQYVFDSLKANVPAAAAWMEMERAGPGRWVEDEREWHLAIEGPATGAALAGRWAAPHVDLDLALPETTDRSLILRADRDRRRVEIRYPSVGARATVTSGFVLYPEVAEGVHAAWFRRPGDLEEMLVLASPESEMTYDLELPQGSSLSQPLPRLVEIREGRRAWLRIRFDRAWCSSGEVPRIEARVDGTTLHVKAESDTWPVVVDPTWQTTHEMYEGRYLHTVTLLDSGDVLVAGGRADGYLDTAELFVPDDGTQGNFTTLKMTGPRASHAAALLPSGKVLLAGSDSDGPYLTSAELYDPGTMTFKPAASMHYERAHHTATLLQSGDVLVVGGAANAEAELYFPDADEFVPIGLPFVPGRFYHTATRLQDGNVLVTGGETHESDAALDITEMYDWKTRKFSVLDQPVVETRLYHRATLLKNGDVLLTGGRENEGAPPRLTGEIYRPGIGFLPLASKMSLARAVHVSGLLQDGKVLLAGGSPLAPWCDLFDPGADPAQGVFFRTSDLPELHNYTEGSAVGQGRVFLSGTGPAAIHRKTAIYIPGSLGQACGGAGECESGSCVDGVCCESACQQTCFACSRAAKGYGADGICEAARAGADPHFDCLVGQIEGSANCPNNGFCDDRGGKCEFPCDIEGRACRLPDRCDGDGCSSTVDCLAGYRCGASGRCQRISQEAASAVPPINCAIGGRATAPTVLHTAWVVAFVGFLAATWRRRRTRPARRRRGSQPTARWAHRE